MSDIKLKQRDFKTQKRFEGAKIQAEMLKNFFDKGFKSFEALKAIVMNYYPDISEGRLWDFWHFRILDDEISEKLSIVFEKLKTE